MRRRARAVWAALVVAGLLAGTARGSAVAQAPDPEYAQRDIVLLVDVSTSMDDIFPTVQAALHTFIDRARLGDSIALVTFSDSAHTREQRVLTSAAERRQLHAVIDRLQPSGRFTNITAALRRATQLMRDARLAPGGSERVQFVLLITDGRHNPPVSAHAPTFDDILHRYGDFQAGSDWFIHYIAVGDVQDDDMMAFLRGARGQISLLDKAQVAGLADVLDQLRVPTPVEIHDRSGFVRVEPVSGQILPASEGQRLQPGDRLVTGAGGRCVITIGDVGIVGLDRGTVLEVREAYHNPVARKDVVTLEVPVGRVWSAVQGDRRVGFRILSPQAQSEVTGTVYVHEAVPSTASTLVGVTEGVVRASDRGGGARIEVRAGQVAVAGAGGMFAEPVAWAPGLRAQQRVWRRVLVDGMQLAEARPTFARLSWRDLEAQFGPLRPGRKFHESFAVDLGGLTSPDLGVIVARSMVPAEIEVRAKVTPPAADDPDGLSIVDVVAHVRQAWKVELDTMYTGEVLLVGSNIAPEPRLAFPVKLFTRTPSAQELAEGARLRVYWQYAGGGLLLLALGVGFVVWRAHTEVAVPLGRLLLRKNPNPQEWTATVLDLEAMCKHARTTEVTIGRAPDNMISLPDHRVRSHHCVIRVRGRRRANRRLYIRLLPKARMRVNTVTIRYGSVELLDGMLVQLGDFVFEYEDSRNAQQVEVALVTKQVIHGVLRSWDLAQATFQVSAEDRDLEAKGTIERMIAFVEVEDISVMRNPHKQTRKTERLRKDSFGTPATISMKSGRSHAGHVRRDYDPKSTRFHFFPADFPAVDYMIIERKNMDGITFPEDAEHA